MRRTVTTATPLYPGSFMSESGVTEKLAPEVDSVDYARSVFAAERGAFAVEFTTFDEQRFTSDEGEVTWLPVGGTTTRRRVYAGQTMTISDVEEMNTASGHRYDILLANMRDNGWDPICRTRRGNFQPLDENDLVLEFEVAV